MEDLRELPAELLEKETFSKKDFVSHMSRDYSLTNPQIAYDLQKRLDKGSIVRVGWNKYSAVKKRRVYSYLYSDYTDRVVEKILENYTFLDFQVYELIQLNEFVNHQIAHNTIFVAVENDLQDFVFDTLRLEYPGKVMLRPSIDEYYKYIQDNIIIIGRLPTESPKGFEKPWHTRLERILVDVLTDKLVSRIVPDTEKEEIIAGAFNYYMIDEDTMIRYSKRKGAYIKLQRALSEYGGMRHD